MSKKAKNDTKQRVEKRSFIRTVSEEIALAERPIFRGFLSGAAFVTKKGYRGNKVDAVWSRQLLDSFDDDDEELCGIALDSCLADLESRVTGGEYGSSFSIGECGFYSECQFRTQASMLEQYKRATIGPNEYLTDSQWQRVNDSLHTYCSVSTARFNKSCRGDTFLVLAMRKFAFLVATVLLKTDKVDPLLLNEEDHDVMDALHEQYSELVKSVRELQEEKIGASTRLLLPTQSADLDRRERQLLTYLENLLVFLPALKENLKERLVKIEHLKISKRKSDLRHLAVSEDVLWGIQQYDRAVKRIKDCDELVGFVKEKLAHHEVIRREHVSLATLVMARHEQLKTDRATSRANSTKPTARSRKNTTKSVKSVKAGELPSQDDPIARKSAAVSARSSQSMLSSESRSSPGAVVEVDMKGDEEDFIAEDKGEELLEWDLAVEGSGEEKQRSFDAVSKQDNELDLTETNETTEVWGKKIEKASLAIGDDEGNDSGEEEENDDDDDEEILDEDAAIRQAAEAELTKKLASIYRPNGTLSKAEIYRRMGMALPDELEESLPPIQGVLKKSEHEEIYYR